MTPLQRLIEEIREKNGVRLDSDGSLWFRGPVIAEVLGLVTVQYLRDKVSKDDSRVVREVVTVKRTSPRSVMYVSLRGLIQLLIRANRNEELKRYLYEQLTLSVVPDISTEGVERFKEL